MIDRRCHTVAAAAPAPHAPVAGQGAPTIGRLTALAHELNQPLLAAATFNEVASHLVLQGQDPVDIEEAIRRVRVEIMRASQGLRDLMLMLQAGGATVPDALAAPQKPVDLRQLVQQAILAYCVSRWPNLPQVELEFGEEQLIALVDKGLLEKVLGNLLLNACEAQHGPEEPCRHCTHVRVARSATANMVTISVQDDGPGVRPDMVPGIFQQGRTSKPTGMGVGLAISKKLIEQNGGRMWYTSGNGAMFSFEIPVL